MTASERGRQPKRVREAGRLEDEWIAAGGAEEEGLECTLGAAARRKRRAAALQRMQRAAGVAGVMSVSESKGEGAVTHPVCCRQSRTDPGTPGCDPAIPSLQ